MDEFRHIYRKIKTIAEKSVSYKRERWAVLWMVAAIVLYRIFEFEYLGLMFFIGLYVIYLIVQYYTPSGLPDPDEDSF